MSSNEPHNHFPSATIAAQRQPLQYFQLKILKVPQTVISMIGAHFAFEVTSEGLVPMDTKECIDTFATANSSERKLLDELGTYARLESDDTLKVACEPLRDLTRYNVPSDTIVRSRSNVPSTWVMPTLQGFPYCIPETRSDAPSTWVMPTLHGFPYCIPETQRDTLLRMHVMEPNPVHYQGVPQLADWLRDTNSSDWESDPDGEV